MNLRASIAISVFVLISIAGCIADLDAFMHNPRHCEIVGKTTCEDVEEEWDRICVPCDEPYDWEKELTYFKSESRPIGIPDSQIEQIAIPTTDGVGELDTYFIRSHGNDSQLAQTTVVFNHGNFGGIEYYACRVRLFYELGFNVVVWEYRGYGKSKPNRVPTAKEFFKDAELILKRAEEFAADSSKILYYGMSLGTAPATHQVGVREPCALVLEVPFSGFGPIHQETAYVGLPESYLVTGDYNNAEKLSHSSQPTLILHAGKDQRFPPPSIQELFDGLPTADKEIHLFDDAIHGIHPDSGIAEMIGKAAYFKIYRDFLNAHASQCLSL